MAIALWSHHLSEALSKDAGVRATDTIVQYLLAHASVLILP